MTFNNIIYLLEFCLKNTYFIFQGRYCEQVKGTAMGSPISPIVANLYMEAFEVKALNTVLHPLSLWRRFVDDTFVVIQSAHKDSFIEHITSIDDRIQFTMEDCRTDVSMPFLDTLVIPQPDVSFSTTVYRKSTQTDLYLQWDSHHTIAAKYSVVNTFNHRARAVCSNPQLLKKEEEHLQRVLIEDKYLAWALNRVNMKINAPFNQDQNKRGPNICSNAATNNQRPYMVVQYIKGLSESLKMHAENMGYKYILKEAIPSKASWWLPEIRIPSQRRVISSIGTNVTGWGVIMNIQGSYQELLERGSGNFFRPPAQYMTILTLLFIVPPLITSEL